MENLTHNELTLDKVHQVLLRAGHERDQIPGIISDFQNEGILFREREEETDEKFDAELCTTEEPREWIERQEEERRAWAIGEAIRVIREADTWDVEALIETAKSIEAFVKGPQEDPDLHDQDALDAVYTFYAEDAKAGVEYLGSLGVHQPTAEEIEQAATNLIDKLTKAGVRFKRGQVITDDDLR